MNGKSLGLYFKTDNSLGTVHYITPRTLFTNNVLFLDHYLNLNILLYLGALAFTVTCRYITLSCFPIDVYVGKKENIYKRMIYY